MISALNWIRKGAAKEVPVRFADQLQDNPEAFDQIAQKIGLHLESAKQDLQDYKDRAGQEDGDADASSEQAMQDDPIPELKDYNLEDYDKDSDDDVNAQDSIDKPHPLFSNLKGLAYYGNQSDDPYLLPAKPEDPDEELEESRILPTDGLLLAAKTEDDLSTLEVYVFEEEEDNLFVHHDILLPSFPLSMAWLDFPCDLPNVSKTSPEKGSHLLVNLILDRH